MTDDLLDQYRTSCQRIYLYDKIVEAKVGNYSARLQENFDNSREDKLFEVPGILEHPLAKMLIENARNGTQSCLKLNPSSSQPGILAKRQSKI